MWCFEINIAPDVLEKVKHRTNDASNDVSRPALCPTLTPKKLVLPHPRIISNISQGKVSYKTRIFEEAVFFKIFSNKKTTFLNKRYS